MAAHYFNTVENTVTGKPVSNASISVTDSGGAELALYSDEALTTPIDNPIITDDTGWFEFYCAEDECEIAVSYGGAVRRTIENVNLLGGSVSADLTALSLRVDDLETADGVIDGRLDVLEAATAQTGNGLASGGIVVWESGLTFRISAATYYIGSTLYASAEQTVTLSAADGSNPRIDVLYLDTSGTFGAITGTAAASPSEPDIDPTTQLKRTFVLVGAALTEPAGVTNENIYLENTEWTGTSSGSGWTLASTTSPYAGTKNIVAAAVAANGYVSYDHGAAITLTSYDIVSMFIKPIVAFPSGRVLRVQWYNNGVALGTPVTIASGYWGFNAATLSFQFVAIPMANFVLPGGTSGDQLRITVVGGALSFQIDNIVLQTQGASIPQSVPGNLTQAAGDARYAIRANNLSDLSSASTARTNLGLGSIATQAASSVTITGGSVSGITDLALADGGTGASLTDPNADRVMFWDDSAGAVTWLAMGTNLTITGTTLDAAGSSYAGGKETIPLLASALTPRTTNGAAEGTSESTTNKVMLRTLDFDQSTIEYAQICIPMPKSWNESTVTVQFVWTASATGNVIWGAQGVALSDDDAVDTAFGTAQTVTDGVTASGDVMISSETSAITIGGTPAEGDLVVFQFYRNASDGSDTLAADAKLIAVKLFITTNAATDA